MHKKQSKKLSKRNRRKLSHKKTQRGGTFDEQKK